MLKEKIKQLPFIKKLLQGLDNFYCREEFILKSLGEISSGENILDAGCGSQQFKKYCSHLIYKSQDFGKYEDDDKKGFASDSGKYIYGKIDYVGNVWQIDEKSNYFDNIICTEVFEHIPYPIETVKEFSRLIKSGGKLILTAPSNCLRHMDPYYFYSGFSDRWYETILKESNFEIIKLETVGDYYSWLRVEIFRAMAKHSLISKLILFPAFIFYSSIKKTVASKNTLCMGYHIIAIKK